MNKIEHIKYLDDKNLQSEKQSLADLKEAVNAAGVAENPEIQKVIREMTATNEDRKTCNQLLEKECTTRRAIQIRQLQRKYPDADKKAQQMRHRRCGKRRSKTSDNRFHIA